MLTLELAIVIAIMSRFFATGVNDVKVGSGNS